MSNLSSLACQQDVKVWPCDKDTSVDGVKISAAHILLVGMSSQVGVPCH